MQLAVRIDKRPGESHTALDGKKSKLLCAQNVKLEATLTQTASVAGILNWGSPYV